VEVGDNTRTSAREGALLVKVLDHSFGKRLYFKTGTGTSEDLGASPRFETASKPSPCPGTIRVGHDPTKSLAKPVAHRKSVADATRPKSLAEPVAPKNGVASANKAAKTAPLGASPTAIPTVSAHPAVIPRKSRRRTRDRPADHGPTARCAPANRSSIGRSSHSRARNGTRPSMP